MYPKCKGMAFEENLLNVLRAERPKIVIALQKYFSLDKAEAEDCFQEGSLGMWRNIREGKLTKENLDCKLETYLKKCCYNHAEHLTRRRGVVIYYKDMPLENARVAPERPELTPEKREMLRVMEEIVVKMESPCREIMWHTYYYEVDGEMEVVDGTPQPVKPKSQEEIAALTGLKNAQTVKAQKVRCMKRLKDRLLSIFNKQ